FSWIISKLVDRIFNENLPRSRKERQLTPQASAGISDFHKPPCLPSAKRAGLGKETFGEITESPRHS
ncbi:MAG: hypothetical protein Q7V48_07580, partial [Deltaproteobacteria bacterium]|nr:hypothetical protein [Deltaproteobacteria bacterium]